MACLQEDAILRRCLRAAETRAVHTVFMGKRESLLDQIEQDLLDGKPTADLLRKCVVLGGRAGSIELRDWASRELKGYDNIDALPGYRKVAAPIQVDAMVGHGIIRGQTIRVSDLPDFTHEHIQEVAPLMGGVGELEALVGRGKSTIKLSLPMGADLARYMDAESGQPLQHINAVYWAVSSSTVAGCIDRIRTTLAELIGEMRAALPAGQAEPEAQQAQQAVNIVVKGFSRANVNQVQSTGGSVSVAAPAAAEAKRSWLARVPKAAWAFTVGAATILAAVFAYLTYVQ